MGVKDTQNNTNGSFCPTKHVKIPQKEMKQKEKKIKDWLKELKHPIKNKAITNLNTNIKNLEVESLSSALLIAFNWKTSVEGFDYWDEIYENLVKSGV